MFDRMQRSVGRYLRHSVGKTLLRYAIFRALGYWIHSYAIYTFNFFSVLLFAYSSDRILFGMKSSLLPSLYIRLTTAVQKVLKRSVVQLQHERATNKKIKIHFHIYGISKGLKCKNIGVSSIRIFILFRANRCIRN